MVVLEKVLEQQFIPKLLKLFVANSWGILRVRAAFLLFLWILWRPACARHKISLCVSPYKLMEDCLILPMGTPEFCRAVLHSEEWSFFLRLTDAGMFCCLLLTLT